MRDAWHLSAPYYRSEEKWSAWGLLAAIISLRLLLVGMTVVLSFWNREFFNSLQDKNYSAFWELLFVYRQTPSGFMPGFCEIAAVYIVGTASVLLAIPPERAGGVYGVMEAIRGAAGRGNGQRIHVSAGRKRRRAR